jgi:hypothetical protein
MEVSEIKNHMAELQNKIIETKNQTTDPRIDQLEKSLNEMKDKYIALLEQTLSANGNRKSETSDHTSKRNPDLQIDKFQLLTLLKESRATTPEFAVSATQLQKTFALNRTTRTIRDKLTALELMNLITSLGQKPKLYYLTSKGLQMISQQQKGLMQVH